MDVWTSVFNLLPYKGTREQRQHKEQLNEFSQKHQNKHIGHKLSEYADAVEAGIVLSVVGAYSHLNNRHLLTALLQNSLIY